MSNSLFVYASELLHHWLALFAGPVVTVVLLVLDKGLKREIKPKPFVALLLIGIPIAMFLAWRDEYTSAEWRGSDITRLTAQLQDEDARTHALSGQLAAKQQPIVVQAAPDPAVEELLERQDRELRALKSEMPSPRKRALQLSNDILKFMADRRKSEPNLTPPVGLTKAGYNQALNEINQKYTRWLHQTGAQYDVRFEARLQAVIDDMQAAGIKTDSLRICVFSNGNTLAMEACGARIGALAEKLPH